MGEGSRQGAKAAKTRAKKEVCRSREISCVHAGIRRFAPRPRATSLFLLARILAALAPWRLPQ
jgi:hypothetical protein